MGRCSSTERFMPGSIFVQDKGTARIAARISEIQKNPARTFLKSPIYQALQRLFRGPLNSMPGKPHQNAR